MWKLGTCDSRKYNRENPVYLLFSENFISWKFYTTKISVYTINYPVKSKTAQHIQWSLLGLTTVTISDELYTQSRHCMVALNMTCSGTMLLPEFNLSRSWGCGADWSYIWVVPFSTRQSEGVAFVKIKWYHCKHHLIYINVLAWLIPTIRLKIIRYLSLCIE